VVSAALLAVVEGGIFGKGLSVSATRMLPVLNELIVQVGCGKSESLGYAKKWRDSAPAPSSAFLSDLHFRLFESTRVLYAHNMLDALYPFLLS